MPFAYITRSGTILKKRGRKIVLYEGSEELSSFGLKHLESVILRGNIQMTSAALRALLINGVETSFLSSKGRLLGHLNSPASGNVHLRMAQYRMQQDLPQRLWFSQQFVRDKLGAMHELLTRYADNYSQQDLKVARQKIKDAERTVSSATTLSQLLGIEGNASAVYWSAFSSLNRSELGFYGRSRRPPRDEVNALLSLGYVLLTNELRALVEAVGFDPYLGIYHELKPNRPSLPLDIIEPFRHVIVDRLVLRLVNLGRLKTDHFQGSEEHGFRLNDAAWKIFLTEYEERMQAPPTGIMQDAYPQARSWRELVRKHCLMLRRFVSQYSSHQDDDEFSPGGTPDE